MDRKRNLVLLAEDRRNMREHYASSIAGLGYEVRAYEDGQAAWEAIQQLTAEDRARALLVTDMQMPRMGGSELVCNVKAAPEHDMPALLWTSGDNDWELPLLKESGADHAAFKTSFVEEMAPLLEQTAANFEAAQAAKRGDAATAQTKISVSNTRAVAPPAVDLPPPPPPFS